ncbi:MAG: DegT/DnrJ/EryC1/StrS family aminotransferase [Armatimonadota bacterium]
MKAGREELMEIIDLWGYSDEAQGKILAILESESPPPPHLFRYYGPLEGKGKVWQAERLFEQTIGTKYALAVNSGTSALMSALAAAAIGPGDEVIVPGYTFFASASVVVASRAIPVICEVNDSLNLDPDDVLRRLTPQTRAIIVVHMKGMPADMDRIMAIAREHDLIVIEDVAQACGGSFGGKKLGTIGDLGCFSFDFYKIAQSGEGGFVATDDEFLNMRAQSWHDTAACWRPDRYAAERREGELFCGENYRMSEMQGAVALAQIRKLEGYVSRLQAAKRKVRDRIVQRDGFSLRRQPDPAGDASTALVMFGPTPEGAMEIMAAMRERGVSAGGRFDQTVRDWHVYNFWEHILEQKTVTEEGCPFTCPYYQGTLPEYGPEMCPNTLDLLGRSIHLGVSEDWSDEEAARIADAINGAVEEVLG